MAELFGTTRNNITMHLSNVFEKELSENSVCKEFLHNLLFTKSLFLQPIIVERLFISSEFLYLLKI